MALMPHENCSTQAVAEGFPAAGRFHEDRHLAYLGQVAAAEAELGRLQKLIDDAMTRLAGAFETLAHAAETDRQLDARDAMLSTLQYHDICSQLLGHARGRLEVGRNMLEGDEPVEKAELACVLSAPVMQADMAPGTVDLF